jgi:hypothetical protein
MFGVSHWEVGDRCIGWIRRWDTQIKSMHDFGGPDHPHGYSTYATGAGDSFQSYGAYLARHALALEAGRLVLTTPIDSSSCAYERWDEWLSRYSPTRRDGLGLADGTGGYPDFCLHDLRDEGGEKVRPSDDPALFASLAGMASDGRVGAFLIGWGQPFDRGRGSLRRGRGVAIGLKASISPTTSVATIAVAQVRSFERR